MAGRILVIEGYSLFSLHRQELEGFQLSKPIFCLRCIGLCRAGYSREKKGEKDDRKWPSKDYVVDTCGKSVAIMRSMKNEMI